MSEIKCPPWCERDHEGETWPVPHFRFIGHDSDTSVIITQRQQQDWYASHHGRKPEVFLTHRLSGPADSADVLVPVREAPELAELLGRLGHPGLSALITKAVAELEATS